MLFVHEVGPVGAPTILFLHAIATSGWMWERQIAALPEYRCIVPDLPGHGQSAAVPWTSLNDTAGLVAEIIRRRATGGRAHIVGLSLGSYVGLQLMSTAGEVVDRAVLSGLNVLPLPGFGLMSIMGYAMAPFLKTNAFIRANAKALRVPEDSFEEYRRSVQQLSRRSYLRASGDAGRFRLPVNAASITAPTLLIAGAREHPLILRSLKETVAGLSNAEGRIAPDVGHGWNGEKPELFTQTIRAWLSQSPLPAELLPIQ